MVVAFLVLAPADSITSGIDGALRQEAARPRRSLRCASAWNTSTNSRPMILRLASGSVDAGQLAQKQLAGIDVDRP
jgi:hypothetical protein